MKILLTDDHQLFLEGMQSVLSRLAPNVEIECCSNGRDAIKKLSNNTFDIALIDLRLPQLDGFGVLTELATVNCLTPIIIVTASEDPYDAQRCIHLGAMGFVSKSSSGEQMVEVIKRVLAGAIVTPQTNLHANTSVGKSDNWATQHNVTSRQFEVLRLIKQGHSNQSIAETLDLSTATVKTHIIALYRTLDVSSRTEAIQKAQQFGLD